MKTYISSDKLKYHPKNVAEFLETGFSSPISAQFQITNRCPFRCVYCDKVHDEKETVIDDRLIDRLKELGVKTLVLTGGEPTIYRNFDHDVRLLAKHFKLGLVTTMFKYHPILETHFEWIKVSMDTVDEEKFKEIKCGLGFKRIMGNIEKLYHRKQSTCPLGTQIVLTNENKTKNEIVTFIETMSPICDYIQIRPVEDLELYPYSEDDFTMLIELKEKYKNLSISDKFYLREKPKSCPARWSQLLINVDHEVMLCCNRVTDRVASIYDIDFLEKSKNHKIDFQKCYHSCVMAGNNHYLNSLQNGVHKDFV
jgi:MoaA/NifB/PqqE/SkfB family radical SAM enzyme